jgi:hypothetical protein
MADSPSPGSVCSLLSCVADKLQSYTMLHAESYLLRDETNALLVSGCARVDAGEAQHPGSSAIVTLPRETLAPSMRLNKISTSWW